MRNKNDLLEIRRVAFSGICFFFCGNLRFILLHATTWLDDCHTSYTRVCITSRGLAFNTFKTSDGLQSLSPQIDVFLLDSISMPGMIANSIVSSKSVWACFWFQKRGLAHKPAMTYGTLSWRSASVKLDSCNDLQAGNQQIRDIKLKVHKSNQIANAQEMWTFKLIDEQTSPSLQSLMASLGNSGILNSHVWMESSGFPRNPKWPFTLRARFTSLSQRTSPFDHD